MEAPPGQQHSLDRPFLGARLPTLICFVRGRNFGRRGGLFCRSCWTPAPLSAQAAAPGSPDHYLSVFFPQMSGPDTLGDNDEGSQKRKSKNLYVGKIHCPHPCIQGAPLHPSSSSRGTGGEEGRHPVLPRTDSSEQQNPGT